MVLLMSTISILEYYHDSRIKIFHHKNYSKYLSTFKANRLASSNFENAITKATGDYLFLADQDDVWLPSKIDKSLSVLRKYGGSSSYRFLFWG